jgi:hypothetical protein
MTTWPFVGSLLTGPVCSSAAWPFTMHARLGDLRPRFRVKEILRGGCRAIARDGRVLLCLDRPLEDLSGLHVCLRLQTWHRMILPGEAAEPFGVLVSVRGVDARQNLAPLFTGDLRHRSEAQGELRLEVGGGMVLDFIRIEESR